jgi:cobalamin transport system permease protein
MSAGVAAPNLQHATFASRVRGRPGTVALALLGALAVLLVTGVAIGSVPIAPSQTIAVIGHRLFGLDVGATVSPQVETIVWDIRLPRVLTSFVVGAGLAVAGATFQGLLRNPLADPFVLGTASGAALGAAIAILLPVAFAAVSIWLLHGFAFTGAVLAALLVFRLGGAGGMGGMTRLLLTGYAVASILTAGLTLAMYVSGSDLRQIFGFLLGGLAGSSWSKLLVSAPLIIAACVAITWRSRSLDGMLLGDRAARHLGVDLRRERGLLLVLASLATAAGVAIAGLIGFVGLVVPHVVRLVVGPSARRVLPLSALAGAVLLASADVIARLVGDVPVGVVMALIGAPFFLFLLIHTRSGYEL